jgi:glycosyltransferase involved in cell wall biosynthesis
VFVGGLREQKAVNILVNAVATVRLQGIDVSLDLVGDGPLRSALTHQVDSLGLHHAVRFHGVLAAEGVAARIRDAHVLVLPSRWEGMSNAGLEALAQGRPVILSQCGGLDDFITSETGWTVPADDSDALRDAIEAASRVGTAGLRHMADAAYALAARHFDVETAVQQHLELFLELTGDTN